VNVCFWQGGAYIATTIAIATAIATANAIATATAIPIARANSSSPADDNDTRWQQWGFGFAQT